MKSSVEEIIPILGTAMGGGFYAGRYMDGGVLYAIIKAPKADGELVGEWSRSSKRVPGADSYTDGLANTVAMAAAGSELAQRVLGLRIGGHDDWHIPSLDMLEVMYRNLKPTTDDNTLYGRSGINVSAVPPTYPYTAGSPVQTLTEAFHDGGAEAFEANWYWTSTQRASYSDYAWGQDFGYGGQDNGSKSASGRAVAVRRLPI